MKVYVVWYKAQFGEQFGTAMWGIYLDMQEARNQIEILKKDFGYYECWFNEKIAQQRNFFFALIWMLHIQISFSNPCNS